MAAYITRGVLVETLNAAGVEFAADATVAELRPMYDDWMRQQRDLVQGDPWPNHAERRGSFGTLSNHSVLSEHTAEDRRRFAPEAAERRAQMQGQPDVDNAQPARLNNNDDDEIVRIQRQLQLARLKRELQQLNDEYHEVNVL